MKLMDKRVSYRNGRYYIKETNIRVDLLVGLGADEIMESYPWLSEKQVIDALDFAKEIIAQRGKREASEDKFQTI